MTCGKLIAALGLVALMAVSATAATPMVDPTGLIYYYSFDGMTTGDRGVNDDSGNGLGGTIVRDVTMDFGVRGAAAKFGNRVCNYWVPPEGWERITEIPDPWYDDFWPDDSLNPAENFDYNYIYMQPSDYAGMDLPTDGFTLALWVNVSPSGDAQATVNPGGYDPSRADHRGWLMHLEMRSDNTYRTVLRTYGQTNIISVNDTVPGQSVIYDEWTHLAWTYDRHGWSELYQTEQAVVSFYINGELRATYDELESGGVVSYDIEDNWDWGMRVGANLDNARQFYGLMDEMYMFNRALDADDIGILAGLTAEAETPVPGDANLDRIVDDKDASIVGANWMVQTGATWFMGDFNNDGAVNDKDAGIMVAHWGQSLGEGAVPEPSTIVLLLGALASLLVWRRRG